MENLPLLNQQAGSKFGKKDEPMIIHLGKFYLRPPMGIHGAHLCQTYKLVLLWIRTGLSRIMELRLVEHGDT